MSQHGLDGVIGLFSPWQSTPVYGRRNSSASVSATLYSAPERTSAAREGSQTAEHTAFDGDGKAPAFLGGRSWRATKRPGFPRSPRGALDQGRAGRIVSRHADTASKSCPSMARKEGRPPCPTPQLRHAAAQCRRGRGRDALWLGHESIRTTDIYQHADIALKERALARVTQNACATSPLSSRRTHYSPSSKRCDYAERAALTRASGPGHDSSPECGSRHNRGVCIKAEGAFRISLARRNSLFSRLSSFILVRSSLVRPGRMPASVSALRTHCRRLSWFTLSFVDID